jgi:hypothetical protein
MKCTSALALLALAACTPAPLSEPAATVEKIYQPLIESKGDRTTDLATIPMTSELALLIQEVESTADGVVFDGDFAGNCQDCTGFSGLKVSDDTETKLAIGEGHKLVRADFKLFEETRSVHWDMVRQDGAWKVDNILTRDFNIRGVAEEAVAAQDADRRAAGEAAVDCMTYIRLYTDAVKKARPGDTVATLDTFFADWKSKAEAAFTAEQLAQYFASNIAVADDEPADQIRAKAEACLPPPPT